MHGAKFIVAIWLSIPRLVLNNQPAEEVTKMNTSPSPSLSSSQTAGDDDAGALQSPSPRQSINTKPKHPIVTVSFCALLLPFL